MAPKRATQVSLPADLSALDSATSSRASTSAVASKQAKAPVKRRQIKEKAVILVSDESQQQEEENITDELLKYFTPDDLRFMKSINYTKNGKTMQVDEALINKYFVNIFPLKLYSSNFQSDFIKSIQQNVFATSLFDDMRKKEQEEILFFTTKPENTNNRPCSYCGSKGTIIQDKQVRCADEGSDAFIFCLSCQKSKKL